MKSYIAHVSSRRLFRALNIESNLARPVIIQIPAQSPGRYTAELPWRRIKLFSFPANSPYVPSTHTLWIFFWSRRMETAPTSIEVLLRPGQSDEPSDLRGSLSPTSVYSTWQSQAVTQPIMNRARRCLTSVIEPTTMSERRIPYTNYNYNTIIIEGIKAMSHTEKITILQMN